MRRYYRRRIIMCYNTIDINECLDDNGGCNHTCTNTPGSYNCSCYDGYLLLEDETSCIGNF